MNSKVKTINAMYVGPCDDYKLEVQCPKCGGIALVDTSMVLTSLPPQYRCVCTSCGHVFSMKCSEARMGGKFTYPNTYPKPQTAIGYTNDYNKFEYVSWSKGEFSLPQRATEGSAGYDFFSPVDTVIYPNETKEFSLEVKCRIKIGEFLMIPPRSSLGFKNDNHVALTNTIGIIDSDYYNNENNEGEIRLRLHNFGNSPFVIKKGMALVQGIFIKFDTTIDDDPRDRVRIGGLGSTDKINIQSNVMYNMLDAKESN